VKFLASFIGSLNFLRLQIKRGGLHLKKLNKIKAWAALTRGWKVVMNEKEMKIVEVQKNIMFVIIIVVIVMMLIIEITSVAVLVYY
ncbi:MAG: hypothetical protein EZS28_037282, partial [Streblomastix strix]